MFDLDYIIIFSVEEVRNKEKVLNSNFQYIVECQILVKS